MEGNAEGDERVEQEEEAGRGGTELNTDWRGGRIDGE